MQVWRFDSEVPLAPLMLAFPCTRLRTTCRCPLSAATCKGESPSPLFGSAAASSSVTFHPIGPKS